MGSLRPVIGQSYDTAPGESMEVIAVGTNGIIVEYTDGRVELLAGKDWQAMQDNLSLQAAVHKGQVQAIQ